MPFRSVPLPDEAHTRLLREIAGLSGLPLHEKLTRAIREGCRLLDLEAGFLSRVQDGTQTVEVTGCGSFQPGDSFPLETVYCGIPLEAGDVVAIDEMGRSPYADRPCYDAFGLEAYIGAPVVVGGETFGTVAFAAKAPRATPFDNDDVTLVRVLSTWVGTTIERMEAEDARRRTEHRLASVLEAAPDAVVLTDLDRTIEYVNPSFEVLFGWSSEEIVGRSTADLYADPDDFAQQGAARYHARVRRDVHNEPYVVMYRRKDGSTFLGETVGGPAAEGDGGPRFLLGFVRDVTAREEARAAAEAATAATAEAVQAKERFLANMSHEMRTPLNAVLGLGHLLAQTPLTDDQAALLDGITTSADALLGLIDDLLDFARLGAGRLPFEAIPFSPAEVAADAQTIVRTRADAKGLALELAVSPAVPEVVVGDPTRFRQVLTNLVSNAVKFTPAGHVTLALDAVPAAGGTRLRVSVEDTGVGIPADRLGAIFNPFTQAADDAARRFGGTGLGLAIVKDLVERQDGSISVESEEGVGTTFRVELPVALPEGTAAPEAAAPPPDLHGLRVLLVEDNEMNRLVARRTLEAWGVEVTEACDGQEALDAIAEAAGADALFDLVLMDLQMPGLDGVEATRRIRADLGLPSERFPVLALTASVLAYQQADVLGAGLDDFLLKPFAPDVLRARIAAHAGRAPAAPEAAADGAPLDLQALSLYTLGDADLMDRVVTLFFTDGRQAIEAMASAASTGDPGLLEASAHSLKAQAGYVGAAALSHTADRIVNAVRAGEAEGIADEVRLALRQYRTAADELRRLYPRDRGEAPRADDRVPRQAEPESARPPAA